MNKKINESNFKSSYQQINQDGKQTSFCYNHKLNQFQNQFFKVKKQDNIKIQYIKSQDNVKIECQNAQFSCNQDFVKIQYTDTVKQQFQNVLFPPFKYKLQTFLNQLKEKLKLKYIKLQQNDNTSLTQQRTNIIKQKHYRRRASTILLSCELGIPKKHLSKLWGTRILNFLKYLKHSNYSIPKIELDKVKCILSKGSVKICDISKVLKENQWLRYLIQTEVLFDDKLLEDIYNSKIRDQSKLLMFQTYQIFKQAIIDPYSFVSWDSYKKQKIEQSNQLFEMCRQKTLQQKEKILQNQFLKRKNFYQNNKCSFQNNISYCWISYLKEIVSQQQFTRDTINTKQYSYLKNVLKQPASIKNIKLALSKFCLSEYIIENKVKNSRIYDEIVLNTKFNIINKLNMLKSVKEFIKAVRNPESLMSWPN